MSATTASRFARAAAVGLVAAACSKEEPAPAPSKDAAPVAVAAPGGDKECCMGKNECKGKGGCAVPESHSCAGKNECKGKGGCNMHCPKK